MSLQPFPDDWQDAVAIVAHPDDLEYGVASAVARWTSDGKRVSYVLATSGEAGIDGVDPALCGPMREEEERRGASIVGVEHVEFLGLADGLVVEGIELRRAIVGAIRRLRSSDVDSRAESIRAHAAGFSEEAFINRLRAIISSVAPGSLDDL